MLPPDAIAQVAPPPTVANAGPLPNSPLLFPVLVVMENVVEPVDGVKSAVAPAERTIPFAASMRVPAPLASTSVCPATTATPLWAGWLTAVV